MIESLLIYEYEEEEEEEKLNLILFKDWTMILADG